jgi:SWI/SNF-related matrix-associated actin-dependent regulator of chromatin subfamily A member 5
MSENALDRLLAATEEYLRHSSIAQRLGDGEEEMIESDDTVITSQPTLIQNCTMRNYQIEGLDWMAQLVRNNMNGILADEMGLGKTLQSISLLALAKERGWKKVSEFPHLVVCPKSTITNWESEVGKFCPSFSPIVVLGTAEERASILSQSRSWDSTNVIITSFDVCRIEIAAFRRVQFGIFILDEAHRIKNEESILSSVVREIKTVRVILLTGTPLQNDFRELWAILNFIMPAIFHSANEFDQMFHSLVYSGQVEHVVGTLHRILKPFMLRRLKADVARDLPEKKELYVYVKLSQLQKQLYKEIVLKNADTISGDISRLPKVRLVNTLMQLRKCCNHPYLFPGIEPGPPFEDGPHLVSNSGKMIVVDKLVEKILSQCTSDGVPNQILIFSQMTKMLDILDDYCRYRKIDHCRIDGSTQSVDRQAMIDEFSRPGTSKRIFLLSTRAGGLGINLTSANFVFIFDADFNPQSDLQAIDRAHRIGQKRSVTVYRFLCEKTVEEKIVERAARKMLIDKLVIKSSTSSGEGGVAGKDELGAMLRFGVSDLWNQEENEGDVDIDKLLEFSAKRTSDLNGQVGLFNQMVLKFENPSDALKEEEVDREPTMPDEVRAAAAEAAAAAAASESTWLVPEVTGPRERKPLLPAKAIQVPVAVPKTKLAEWRAKVGGGYEYQFFSENRLDELESIEKDGGLTKSQKNEQEKLLKEGFANWSRRHFQTVVRCLEEYGRNEGTSQRIHEMIPEKSENEIERYIDALFKRGKKFLGESYIQRLSVRMKKRDEVNKQVEMQMSCLDRKIEEFHGNMWEALPVVSPPGATWTNDMDRALLCSLHVYGYGDWDSIRRVLRVIPKTLHAFSIHHKSSEIIRERADLLLDEVHRESSSIKRRNK